MNNDYVILNQERYGNYTGTCPAARKHEKCHRHGPGPVLVQRERERETLVATLALLGILSTVLSAQALAMPLAKSQSG